MAKQLQQIWCDQAVEMAQLLRIHRQSYELKHVPSQVADAVQTPLRVLVHQLEHSYKFLRFCMALCKKLKPATDAVHAVQLLSQRGTVMLPTEAVAILARPRYEKCESHVRKPRGI
ncbi:transcriptional regulator family: Fungal Specific TF [Penicillium citrinum]|uniref:Transcriptional regulator family: Fungal Specific TF n=1 Tax=Penicillium citrinum TaxID=5077 RepID=A0A9W9PCN6_PENCI|nr:transcriptional regulator family: Fungal Specific TF [Penicillium citrinum]KAJ5240447.1 transcriptional regulator family: Fungal Specific TF [Penicillium citrinum]